jgi:hypothetical protein
MRSILYKGCRLTDIHGIPEGLPNISALNSSGS